MWDKEICKALIFSSLKLFDEELLGQVLRRICFE